MSKAILQTSDNMFLETFFTNEQIHINLKTDEVLQTQKQREEASKQYFFSNELAKLQVNAILERKKEAAVLLLHHQSSLWQEIEDPAFSCMKTLPVTVEAESRYQIFSLRKDVPCKFLKLTFSRVSNISGQAENVPTWLFS